MDVSWCSVANSWMKFAGGIYQQLTNKNMQDVMNTFNEIFFIVNVIPFNSSTWMTSKNEFQLPLPVPVDYKR